ncbi:MAG: hypothetical protein HUJ27_08480 [Rhodobacteraceae bacterium]|nr:hypothetical protein [Paracoccaceae bacterium]
MIKRIAFLTFLATSVDAETAMTAAEFESYATGKTLTYAEGGIVYGIEEYLPDRNVRWSFLDGECTDGYWYANEDLICFRYVGIADAQCWRFFQRSGQLIAQFESDASIEYYEAQQTSAPLQCRGPDVGV